MQNHLFSKRPIVLSMQDVESITKDSPITLLNALYQCQDFMFVDSKNNPNLNKSNITQTFSYKSSFYLSFIANKDSLSTTYLEARKVLYKSFQQIKQEQVEELQRSQRELEQQLQGLASQVRESKLQELQREYTRKQREKERQERLHSRVNKRNVNNTNNLILESNDKNNIIIFLDSANSLSNLIHIHNNKIDIFTKDKSIIDIQEIVNNYKDYGITLDSLHSANTQTFLYSHLLIGSKEVESNPLYFGELDSTNTMGLDDTKPIYHLTSETDYDTKGVSNTESNSTDSNNNLNNTDYNSTESKDSNTESNNSLSTLNIFLDSSTLTLLNYSLLDSSLNIKLELLSKESKAILEREKAQRDKQKEQDSKAKDSQSTAMLHPVLEDNEIKCPHNGVVKLKSNKGKPFKSKDIPMILESDLLNSQIIGCNNNILGVPTPCNLVSIILPSARGLKKFNDDYPIMQNLVSSGVMSDKGFPLIATPKPNTFRINSPSPSLAKEVNKESIKSNIDTSIPLCKIITSFKDLDEFYLTPTTYENRDSKDKLISNQTNFYDTYKQIDIELDSISKDTNTLDSGKIESNQCLKYMLDALMFSCAII